MCDNAGDIEDIKPLSRKEIQKRIVKKCKKCGEKPILLLQKKDQFCRPCFLEYCNHKFRSTIGKTKTVKHGEKVLLAYSGGRKSAALLHMTKQTLDSASSKQISFTPGVLYIDESVLSPFIKENNNCQSDQIIQDLKNFGYLIIVSRLEMVCKLRSDKFYWIAESSNFSDEAAFQPDAHAWFQCCLKDMSLSERCDLVKHMRLLLMTEIANSLSYNYLFVGDSANSLAVDLLTDISLGRGSQISSDTCFFDSRYKVPVCRPIREFLNKELLFYNHLHQCSYTVVPDLLTKTESTCIQRLTECFINDLQENFPATVFTIFRTGGKLSLDNISLSDGTCLLCKSKLDNVNLDPCSAIEALRVSERLSIPVLHEIENESLSLAESEANLKKNIILKHLCHGCSILFRNKTLKVENFNFICSSADLLNRTEDVEQEIRHISIDDKTTYS